MPNTVDKIRRALEKRDGIAEEEMRPLAEEYLREVQLVNGRLDDAVLLLRKGLRSEAIQRIEMTPHALDAAAELDFPEWDEWNEILQFMAIPLPPKLNQEYVSQINEAIIESLPLDALLRRHRRLAIAKAPLGMRLGILRQIARVDPANRVWNDDVEAWEKIRLQQIDNELRYALEQEDSRSLMQLHKELSNKGWRIKPAGRMVEQTKFAAQAHAQNSMQVELGPLAPQLLQAFADKNEQVAKQLRAQWQTVRAKYSIPVPAELEQSVGPALTWLEDLDRQSVMESERQMAVANLEATLDANASIEEVEQAYQQASRFGEAVPENLASRVAEISAKPERAKKRKLLAIGAGVAVLVVAGLISGVVMMINAGKETARREKVKQMQSFVAAEKYQEAIQYFSSIESSDPEVAREATMVALLASARRAVDEKEERLAKFDRLLAEASDDDPKLIDDSLLPRLRELAESDGQLAQVERLEKLKTEFMLGEKRRQSDEMLAKLDQLRKTFEQLESRGSSATTRQAINGLLSDVVRLPNAFPEHSRDAAAKQETLRSRIASTLRQLKDTSMVTQQRTEAIQELASARDLQVYADLLRNYSTQSVSNTRFADFATVLDEEDHWMNVERVNRWLADLDKDLENGIASREAVSLIESAERLQGLVSPNPVFVELRDFTSKMREIVGRRRILDRTFDQIAKHPLASAVSIPISDPDSSTGVTHYLVKKLHLEENRNRFSRVGSLGVEVISDQLGGVRNRAFQGPLPKPDPEPMKTISELVNDKARNVINYDQAWEQQFLTKVGRLLQRDDLDGPLKEWLIYYLLRGAVDGSDQLKALMPRTMANLERRTSLRERWYDPRPKDSEMDPGLKQILRSEAAVAFGRTKNPFSQMQSVADRRLKWIGFLIKSSSGEIEYHLRGAMPSKNGRLYVAAAPTDAGSAETSIYPVGVLTDGHIKLEPNPVHKVAGRPLFYFAD